MTINIEKMRAEMQTENKRFLVQALGVAAACVAAGAGLVILVLHLARLRGFDPEKPGFGRDAV